ncbi:hypothetical protein PVAP13_6KG149706 [Panicum virgatum]|uniref:Uncharacterized protein n=1 Tax=Panicum virgatum TaxID=38727 RepID=A0A8T0RD01_PANVG|nr:hypothetical protein PVAP13_6KG149706 [Panicum virgatum]
MAGAVATRGGLSSNPPPCREPELWGPSPLILRSSDLGYRRPPTTLRLLRRSSPPSFARRRRIDVQPRTNRALGTLPHLPPRTRGWPSAAAAALRSEVLLSARARRRVARCRRQLAGDGHATSSSKEHLPPSTHPSPLSVFPSTRVRSFSGRIGLASPSTKS